MAKKKKEEMYILLWQETQFSDCGTRKELIEKIHSYWIAGCDSGWSIMPYAKLGPKIQLSSEDEELIQFCLEN
jgi:hypothetical protein